MPVRKLLKHALQLARVALLETTVGLQNPFTPQKSHAMHYARNTSAQTLCIYAAPVASGLLGQPVLTLHALTLPPSASRSLKSYHCSGKELLCMLDSLLPEPSDHGVAVVTMQLNEAVLDLTVSLMSYSTHSLSCLLRLLRLDKSAMLLCLTLCCLGRTHTAGLTQCKPVLPLSHQL